MKHDARITGQLLGWTLASLIIGLLIAPRAFSIFGKELEGMNPLAYGVMIVLIIGVTAFAWLKMMKNMKPENVDQVFSFGMGAITSKAVSLFVPGLFYTSDIFIPILARGITLFGFWWLYLKMIRVMQKSWKNTVKLSPINNLIMCITLPVAATILAIDMSIYVALAVLFVASLYDAWAVWKSKTMVKMAKYFIGRRMVPGIGIPKATEKKGFAILGGGDIFFIVLVSTTMYEVSPVASAILSAMMFTALVILFAISEEKKFYPALPFIFIGAIVGVLITWVVL